MTNTNRKLKCISSNERVPFRVGVCYEAFIGENSVCVLDEQDNQYPIPSDTLAGANMAFAWVENSQAAERAEKQ